MNTKARLELDGKTHELPVIIGTEGERAFDISALRQNSGYITLDDGYELMPEHRLAVYARRHTVDRSGNTVQLERVQPPGGRDRPHAAAAGDPLGGP